MARKDGRPEIAKMSFEDALEELKEIVSAMESGEGRLDQAIEAYERGAALKSHCEAKLREAQEKIEKIALGSGGKVTTDAFDAG